jgi:hypothetical protein
MLVMKGTCIKFTLSWAGFERTTLVVIETDCTGSCKSNYHTISYRHTKNFITSIVDVKHHNPNPLTCMKSTASLMLKLGLHRMMFHKLWGNIANVFCYCFYFIYLWKFYHSKQMKRGCASVKAFIISYSLIFPH